MATTPDWFRTVQGGKAKYALLVMPQSTGNAVVHGFYDTPGAASQALRYLHDLRDAVIVEPTHTITPETRLVMSLIEEPEPA